MWIKEIIVITTNIYKIFRICSLKTILSIREREIDFSSSGTIHLPAFSHY